MNNTCREIGITTETDSGNIKYVSWEEAKEHLRKSSELLPNRRVGKTKKIEIEAEKKPVEVLSL